MSELCSRPQATARYRDYTFSWSAFCADCWKSAAGTWFIFVLFPSSLASSGIFEGVCALYTVLPSLTLSSTNCKFNFEHLMLTKRLAWMVDLYSIEVHRGWTQHRRRASAAGMETSVSNSEKLEGNVMALEGSTSSDGENDVRRSTCNPLSDPHGGIFKHLWMFLI